MEIEMATALIWTLRIVLPIVLFCIYFKLQSPKDEYPGPARNAHTRQKMLMHRKFALSLEEPKPESLETMKMADATQAPALFATPAKSRGRGGADRSRGDRGDRGDRDDREDRRNRKDRGERGERGERGKLESKPAPEEPPPPEPSPPEEEVTAAAQEQEKMHLESLLNYVAFNRKEQQRTFLCDETGAQPPPPPKARRPAGAPEPVEKVAPPEAPSKAAGALVSQESAEKANAEAQMVLAGAKHFKRADVATDLFEKLQASEVEISERTYTLMIEACVLASDLKTASDLLMKMETSGFCPNTELLDKVMDLYSQQKTARETSKAGKPEENSSSPLDKVLEEVRAKLSKDADLFVPAVENDVSTGPTLSQRTALCAAAKPFESQFNAEFESHMYSWSPDDEGMGGQDGYDNYGGYDDWWGDNNHSDWNVSDNKIGKGSGKSKGTGQSEEKPPPPPKKPKVWQAKS